MKLKVAVQIDPMSKLNLERDTSLLLAYEAQQRGADVHFFQPKTLTYKEGKLTAAAQHMPIALTEKGFKVTTGTTAPLELGDTDVLLIRQDPPFDMAYITNTYLLDQLFQKTLVINRPSGIRNAPEKLLPLEFPSLIPPTLMTQNGDEIEQFCKHYQEIVIKPLFDYGGQSVFRLNYKDGQLRSLIQLFDRLYPNLPVIVQPFLAQVLAGDKRIILIDGEVIGGYTRVPTEDDFRSNQLMGGTPIKCDLSSRDLEICRLIRPKLKELGLFFVGIDIIGEYLIEINVTSPTGLFALNHLNGIHAEKIFWDKIEENMK